MLDNGDPEEALKPSSCLQEACDCWEKCLEEKLKIKSICDHLCLASPDKDRRYERVQRKEQGHQQSFRGGCGDLPSHQ